MPLFRFISVGAIILLFIQPVFSQVNIEQKRKTLAKDSFTGSLSLSFNATGGNTESVRWDNAGTLVYQTGKHLSFLLLSASMGEKSGGRFINKGMGHLRYNLELVDPVSWEIFLQSEYNEFTLLKHRELAGSGLRFSFVLRKNFDGAAGIAAMYEGEVLESGNFADRSSDIYRGSSYFSLGFTFNEIVSINEVIYFQPGLSDISDYRILNDTNITMTLNGNIDFFTNFNYRYDSKPPPGVENYDYEIKNGVTVSF